MEEPRTRPFFRVLGTMVAVAIVVVLGPLFLQHAHSHPTTAYNDYIGLAGGSLACAALVYRVWTIR